MTSGGHPPDVYWIFAIGNHDIRQTSGGHQAEIKRTSGGHLTDIQWISVCSACLGLGYGTTGNASNSSYDSDGYFILDII